MTNMEGKTLNDSEVEFFNNTEKELFEVRSEIYELNYQIQQLVEKRKELSEKEYRLINNYIYTATSYAKPIGPIE